MELFNESFTLVFTYHLYTFTDWMLHLENRMLVGKILMYLAIFNIALNVLVTIRQNVFRFTFKIKIYYKRWRKRSIQKAESKKKLKMEKKLQQRKEALDGILAAYEAR